MKEGSFAKNLGLMVECITSIGGVPIRGGGIGSVDEKIIAIHGRRGGFG